MGDGESRFSDSDRVGVGARGGDKGDLGPGEVDLEVTSRKDVTLDGDLDNDRRSWRNAAAEST